MMKVPLFAVAVCLGSAAVAQGLSGPPGGDNQRATVTQQIGPVTVSVDYSSPRVTLKGDNRRGKIWGTLVPYGLTNLGPTCTQCPWRAGANENTRFTASHEVKIQGQTLAAGTYGVHIIPGKDQWTVIFSKNSSSWGSFSYDAKEDALRVQTKPAKNEYHEWLTYEFITREPTQATLALEWEDLKAPVVISVDNVPAIYAAELHDDLRSSKGFDWHNVEQAAQYLLDNKLEPANALKWAQQAADPLQGGDENINTLVTLSHAQQANGQEAEAAKTMERALVHPAAKPLDLHFIGRQLLATGKKEEALKIFQANAKRFPDQWPVHVGLMRGYAAVGDNKKALDEGRLAQKQAPDEANRKNLEKVVKLLEAGKKID